jgi:hypothetical protein
MFYVNATKSERKLFKGPVIQKLFSFAKSKLSIRNYKIFQDPGIF